MNESGKLSVVATPIGNMEDITLRALRVLAACDYVLCEDTRMAGKLMARHEINAKLVRYDAHASDRVHSKVLEDLAAGQHIALISDAGTPGVSDPGVLLVQKVRAAEYLIEAIPGPSAVTAAVSIAGLTGNQFTFLGFVPHKKGRQTFFERLLAFEQPVVFFESPHRIIKTLQALNDTAESMAVDWTVHVGRELTKMHEEMVAGTPAYVLDYFVSQPQKQKGEFVVIVSKT